jgi:hypothetical protein
MHMKEIGFERSGYLRHPRALLKTLPPCAPGRSRMNRDALFPVRRTPSALRDQVNLVPGGRQGHASPMEYATIICSVAGTDVTDSQNAGFPISGNNRSPRTVPGLRTVVGANLPIPVFRRSLDIVFIAAVCLLATFRNPAAGETSPCDFYASPTGKGDGSSSDQPLRVPQLWAHARPGMTLCLLDGTYSSPDEMITPPRGLSGSDGSPIIVRAVHDGKVLIDGQKTRRPVSLSSNDYFVVEGINACCSSATVVEISHSHHDVIRRVAAWDAHDGNDKIFGVHDAQYNLLEDVAGWGTARKTFEFSYGGDFTTVRRAWGRWEQSTVSGPKMVYSLAYNNYHTLIENALGTWSGEAMPETYTVKDYYGRPYNGHGGGPQHDRDVVEAYGVFAIDGVPSGMKADARLLGSLAYLNLGDVFKANRLIFVTKLDGVRIANTVAYYPPEAFLDKMTFGLYPMADGSNPSQDAAMDITGFGGMGREIKGAWSIRNELQGRSPAAVYRAGENIFNTKRGANLCYRYENGNLTDKPLWPWPMNQRIIDAMIQSGRSPVDVTVAVERMFGSIPPECRMPALDRPRLEITPNPIRD